MDFTKVSTHLSESFAKALEEEQKLDVDETNKLLSSQSPKQLAKQGLAIVNLAISSTRTGMGGRTIITLELDPAVSTKGQELDFGEIRTGDIVRVSQYSTGSDTKKKTSTAKSKSKSGGNDPGKPVLNHRMANSSKELLQLIQSP